MRHFSLFESDDHNFRKTAEDESNIDYRSNPFGECPNCWGPLLENGDCPTCGGLQVPEPSDSQRENMYYTPTFSQKGLEGVKLVAELAYKDWQAEDDYDPYDEEWGDTEGVLPAQNSLGTIIQMLENAQPDERGLYPIRLNYSEWRPLFDFFKVVDTNMRRLESGGPDPVDLGQDQSATMDQYFPGIVENWDAVDTAIGEFVTTSLPEDSSNYGLENIPTMEENPAGHLGHIAAAGVIYPGRFVKGDGVWLAYIPSGGGRPDPEPGDLATLTMANNAYAKRPVTLVELANEDGQGTSWLFTTGHHKNETPNPIEHSPGLQAEASDHPHRRELDTWRERRPGQLRQKPQVCLTPVNQVQEEPQEPVDPDNPEGYAPDDPRHPYWQ